MPPKSSSSSTTPMPVGSEIAQARTSSSLFHSRNQRIAAVDEDRIERPKTSSSPQKHHASSSSPARDIPLPMSLGLCEKYDPQLFEASLRKTFKTKFDEELHKIKERTDVMLRESAHATRIQREFEFRRTQEMIGFEKRIPKQAIIHKIERFHRAKFPSFSIDKCLAKKVRGVLPENASRFEIRQYEEKKIDTDLTRKSALVRQQDIIKQGLTLHSRQLLGCAPPQPTNQEYNSEEESTPEDDTNPNNQQNNSNNNDPSSSTPDQQNNQPSQSSPPPKPQPLNRHAHPCNSSYHDDESISRQQYKTSSRSTSRTSPAIEESPLNFFAWKKPQSQLTSTAGSTTQYSNDNMSSFFHLRRKRAQSSLQSTNQFSESSPSQQYAKVEPVNSSYLGKPSTAYSSNRTNSPNPIYNHSVDHPIFSKQQQKEQAKIVKLEQKREQRQQSPLNFLFNKYAQLVQSNDVQSYAMKKLSGMYIKDSDSIHLPKNSLYHNSYTPSVESSPTSKPINVKFNQVKAKESLSPRLPSRRTQRHQRQQQQQRPSDKSADQLQENYESPFINKFDLSSHHNHLIQTLKDLKKDSQNYKSRSPSRNMNSNQNSHELSKMQGKESNHLIQLTSMYDNVRGQYNVSDFLKRVQDEKQSQSERETKALRLQKKLSISKPESPRKSFL